MRWADSKLAAFENAVMECVVVVMSVVMVVLVGVREKIRTASKFNH
jgi:hypothetical protein